MLLRFLPAALLLLVTTSPYASEINVNEISPVVVTANRVAQTVSDTVNPVSIITRQDIERAQA